MELDMDVSEVHAAIDIITKTVVGFLEQHQVNRDWLITPHGRFYVRKGSSRIYTGNMIKHTFDFANLQIHDEFRGQGIMHSVLNWAVDNIKTDAIYVESVENPLFAKYLIDNGWTPAQNDPISFFKLTKFSDSTQ